MADQIAKVKGKIKSLGTGAILGSYQVDYAPAAAAPTPSAKKLTAVSPAGLPSNCHLNVTVYYVHRTSSYSSVYNESSTYCPGATGINMDMTIIKLDTVWDTTSTVAGAWSNGASGEVEYLCPTGNISGFRGETYGQLTIAGTRRSASAYDGDATSGYYRYSCG